MKLIICVVAGAMMGVTAVAGENSEVTPLRTLSGLDTASLPASTAVIGEVITALRSGEATYVPSGRAVRADYVPLRPPL